jgi:hypothetical protein
VEAEDRADDITQRLGEDEVATAVLLLPWDSSSLPIGDIVQGVGAAGHQVIAVLPLEEPDTPTVLIIELIGDGGPVRHPYLRWGSAPGPIDRPALLRLINEYVVEGFVWRVLEQRLRELDTHVRELETRLVEDEHARTAAVARADQLAAELTAATASLAEADVALARSTAERDTIRWRMQRIETSTFYRIARRLAVVKHALVRAIGLGRNW